MVYLVENASGTNWHCTRSYASISFSLSLSLSLSLRASVTLLINKRTKMLFYMRHVTAPSVATGSGVGLSGIRCLLSYMCVRMYECAPCMSALIYKTHTHIHTQTLTHACHTVAFHMQPQLDFALRIRQVSRRIKALHVTYTRCKSVPHI